MTLIVPTNYRRSAFRERNQMLAQEPDLPEDQKLTCLRCFRPATIGNRCDECRAHRAEKNKGRKR